MRAPADTQDAVKAIVIAALDQTIPVVEKLNEAAGRPMLPATVVTNSAAMLIQAMASILVERTDDPACSAQAVGYGFGFLLANSDPSLRDPLVAVFSSSMARAGLTVDQDRRRREQAN